MRRSLAFLALGTVLFLAAPRTAGAAPLCACYYDQGLCQAADASVTTKEDCEEHCTSSHKDKWDKKIEFSSEAESEEGKLGTKNCADSNAKRQKAIDAATTSEETKAPIVPVPGFEIPGLEYPVPKFSDGLLEVDFIGRYISAVYRALIDISTTVAIVMIMIAGAQYVIAAGGGDVSKAKERIKNAIVGLVLLLGTYVILFTINPDLTQMQSLKLLSVKRVESADHVDPPAFQSAQATDVPCPPYNLKNFSEVYACRKACHDNLPEEKQSKPAKPEYADEKWFGLLDCGHTHGVRELSAITTIGLHEGRIGPAIPWWWYLQSQGKFGVSSHYFIEKDGRIRQVIDERLVAGHGIRNSKSIGIDIMTCPSDGKNYSAEETRRVCGLNSAQYAALNTLIADIKSRTSVTQVIGHCETSALRGRRIDPRMIDWSKIGEDPDNHWNGNCQYTANWTPEEFIENAGPPIQ